jgi:hypothetical protein
VRPQESDGPPRFVVPDQRRGWRGCRRVFGWALLIIVLLAAGAVAVGYFLSRSAPDPAPEVPLPDTTVASADTVRPEPDTVLAWSDTTVREDPLDSSGIQPLTDDAAFDLARLEARRCYFALAIDHEPTWSDCATYVRDRQFLEDRGFRFSTEGSLRIVGVPAGWVELDITGRMSRYQAGCRLYRLSTPKLSPGRVDPSEWPSGYVTVVLLCGDSETAATPVDRFLGACRSLPPADPALCEQRNRFGDPQPEWAKPDEARTPFHWFPMVSDSIRVRLGWNDGRWAMTTWEWAR